MAKISGGWELGGLRGFQALLEKASDEIQAQVADAAQETAERVVARARARAPVEKGDLRRFIAYTGRGMNLRAGILAGDVPGRGGQNVAHRTPSVYGVWYEYGFRTKNIDTRSFMRDSRDDEAAPHLKRLEAAINGAFSSAASSTSRHL